MKTLKKLLAGGLTAALLLAALTACGAKDTTDTKKDDTSAPAATTQTAAKDDTAEGDAAKADEPTELSGVVNTDGSTSMEKVIKALAESFMQENPDVTVNYSATGSGSGIEAAVSGTADIGLSSRELKDEETASGAVANIVALDGVAIVVSPENPVDDLTTEQIAKIFTGEIKNWSELGGEDLDIAVYGREAGSGTRGAFEEIVGVEDACAYTNEYSSTGDVIGSVAGNPNAIGYASLSAVGDQVKAVKVGGVACTEDTVKDGSYTIQRPFVMVTKDGTELSPVAQAFLDYAMSADVAEIIAAAGAVAANG